MERTVHKNLLRRSVVSEVVLTAAPADLTANEAQDPNPSRHNVSPHYRAEDGVNHDVCSNEGYAEKEKSASFCIHTQQTADSTKLPPEGLWCFRRVYFNTITH